MSDGGRCAKHDNWHAHCQQCCREEVAALRAQVATRAEKLAVLADAAEELGLSDVAEMLRSGEVPEISPREMDGKDPDGIAWRLRPRRTGQRVR